MGEEEGKGAEAREMEFAAEIRGSQIGSRVGATWESGTSKHDEDEDEDEECPDCEGVGVVVPPAGQITSHADAQPPRARQHSGASDQ